MIEDEVLANFSTPGLKRNKLTRQAKKLNMEFDERGCVLWKSKEDRDAFLDQYFPEE